MWRREEGGVTTVNVAEIGGRNNSGECGGGGKEAQHGGGGKGAKGSSIALLPGPTHPSVTVPYYK